MANYKTPGVYIEQISTLPASIAGVETAIPAFIGYTNMAEKDGESLLNKPTRIGSMLEYTLCIVHLPNSACHPGMPRPAPASG